MSSSFSDYVLYACRQHPAGIIVIFSNIWLSRRLCLRKGFIGAPILSVCVCVFLCVKKEEKRKMFLRFFPSFILGAPLALVALAAFNSAIAWPRLKTQRRRRSVRSSTLFFYKSFQSQTHNAWYTHTHTRQFLEKKFGCPGEADLRHFDIGLMGEDGARRTLLGVQIVSCHASSICRWMHFPNCMHSVFFLNA